MSKKQNLLLYIVVFFTISFSAKAQKEFACINVNTNSNDTFTVVTKERNDSIFDYGIMFANKVDTAYVHSKKFIKNIQLNIPIKQGIKFYRIEFYKNNNQLFKACPIVLFPDDSVTLTLTDEEENGLKKVIVQGNNAAGHEYFLNNYFTLLGLGIYNDKDSLFDRFYIASTRYIDSLMSIWNSLLIEKKISKPCYDFYLADTRAELYQQVLDELKRIYFKKEKIDYKRLAFLLNFKDLVFYKSNARDAILLKTPDGFQLYNEYLKYILEIDPSKDSILNYSGDSYFFLYDTAYRETAWGKHLLDNYKDFINTVWQNETDSNYIVFKHYYPNSSFNYSIDSFIATYFKTTGKFIQTSPDKYPKLKQFLSKMPNRFVYIDLWATWCQPCIREMKYRNTLKDSLTKMNIGLAMISEDKESDKNVWQNFLIKNRIKEYGTIVDTAMLAEISELIKPAASIPQYILYDKQQQIFYTDMPHPSSGKYLYQKMREITSSE